MTVRWKPLLILSGLFVVVALVGLMTIATVMGSRGTADILARARREVKAKEYEKAKLDYKRALVLDPKDASIHEEMANLYDEWSRQAPPEKKAELRGLYLASLTASTKNNGAKRVEPRRKMLAEAMRLDDHVAAGLAGVAGVQQQVHDRVLDQRRIPDQGREVRLDLLGEANARLREAVLDERDSVGDHRARGDSLSGGRVAPGQAE